jgi:branched-chain amino acid transport system substrate-binding protein
VTTFTRLLRGSAIGALIVSASVLIANYQGIAGRAADSPPNSDEIRIGFVTSLTGVAAEASQNMVNGMQLYLDQVHHKIAGKNVRLIVENDGSNPATSAMKILKLVNQDHCQIIDGFILGNIGYAIIPTIEKCQIPTVYAIVASDDVTQRKQCKWIVRSGWSSSQPVHPFGEWVYKQLGYKKIACLGMDYPFGWEVVGGFQKSFEEAGGKIVQKVWAPLGFQEFTPYLEKIDKKADALFVLTSNVAAGIIPKELKAQGVKMPIIAGGTSYDESVLNKLGDEAVGVFSVAPYSAALDTPANNRFVAAYKAKYHSVPSWFAEGGYTSGLLIGKAIESLKGDVSNSERILAALKKAQVPDAPRGPVKLDEYANPVENIYVRKVQKVNGQLQNTVIATFKDVSQFWHWPPAEFLKQPVYSRTYPPCKDCVNSN